MILASWQDRPLSIAGKITLKGQDAFHPQVRLVDFAKPLLTIPELAIHMNRKVNEGVALKKQKEMLPLMAVLGKDGDKNFFDHWLAKELGCEPEEILAYELNLYPTRLAVSWAWLENWFRLLAWIILPQWRLVYRGLLTSSVKAQELSGIRLAAFFDNEEIGSRTKQGAGLRHSC